MIPPEDIATYKNELKSIQKMRDDIHKKLYCLGIITEALEKIDEKIILFGGSAVEHYTFGGYEGEDVDVFGTNEEKITDLLRVLGFESSNDHYELDCFPWAIHYAFTEEDVINERITTVKVNGKYKIYMIRVENAIIDQLWKIIEREDSNLYYAVARDMIDYHQDNIDFKYLHALANNQRDKLMIILRTIEALLNLETQE